MKKQLVILVSSFSTVGPITSCSGATKAFLQRGHRVIFMIEPSFKGKLEAQGFEEYICKHCPDAEQPSGLKPGESTARQMLESGIIGPTSSLNKIKLMVDNYVESEWLGDWVKNVDQDMKEAINEYQPNLIILDNLAMMPSMHSSGIPWIQLYSTNPATRHLDDTLPPGASGNSGNKN